METTKLIERYEHLTNNGKYNKASYVIADAIGLKMKIGDYEYKRHLSSDKESRCVFKITLKKGGKQFTFNFGQSIAEGTNEPTLYDVLACLQKYDVGSFVDFCREFGYSGYDQYTGRIDKQSLKIYNAVVKEYEGMQRLFNSEELELLQIIR